MLSTVCRRNPIYRQGALHEGTAQLPPCGIRELYSAGRLFYLLAGKQKARPTQDGRAVVPKHLRLPPYGNGCIVRTMVRQYSLRFGGNPVGDNSEITAALTGKNPKQVVFLNPDDGARINAKGQLVDNWDHPYFFHQLSRTEMEIQSAGPDRRMWTADDLVIK